MSLLDLRAALVCISLVTNFSSDAMPLTGKMVVTVVLSTCSFNDLCVSMATVSLDDQVSALKPLSTVLPLFRDLITSFMLLMDGFSLKLESPPMSRMICDEEPDSPVSSACCPAMENRLVEIPAFVSTSAILPPIPVPAYNSLRSTCAVSRVMKS